MVDLNFARKRVKPTTDMVLLQIPDAGIPDILELIVKASAYGPGFTRRLAPSIQGQNQTDTLYKVWEFIRTRIAYKRDKPGAEVVKSPGKLVKDGVGDCKSMTVKAVSLMTNFGIPYRFRVAFYDPANPHAGHIYPIATVNGKDIIVDAVHHAFNEEVDFWKAYDYKPDGRLIKEIKGGLAGISGTPSNNIVSNLVKLIAFGFVAYKIFR